MNKQYCLRVFVLSALLMGSSNLFCSSSCSSIRSCCPTSSSSSVISSTGSSASCCSTGCRTPCNTVCNTGCNDCHSTSFLRPRPISQNMVLQYALSYYDQYYKSDYEDECGQCRRWLQADVRGFYYRSTRLNRTAQALLPNCKECISVAEQGTTDQNALWYKIIAESEPSNNVNDLSIFRSNFEIRPRRQVYGAAFNLRANFGDLCDVDCLAPLWVSVYVPIGVAKHNLNICEELQSNGVIGRSGDNFNKNLTAALTNSDRQFQRFYCGSEKSNGHVDDVLIQIGYDAFLCDCWTWGLYGLVFAPSGDRSDARLAFEPVLGTGHTGLGFGFYGDLVVDQCDETLWSFLYQFRYAYFLKREECRTFDLCRSGDWSRNILVVRENTTQNPLNQVTPLPGVNFLTQSVDVTPRSMIEFWLAFHYQYCNWNLEFGYDFWYKQREKICLDKCTSLENIGVFDIANVVCTGEAVSATQNAKICQITFNPIDPASDGTFTAIRTSDLDLTSAVSPSASSSQFYIAGSCDWDTCYDYPIMTGLGVSYEVGHGRGALSQVGVWAIVGAQF